MTTELHLVLPDSTARQSDAVPRLPALETLLGRADRQAVTQASPRARAARLFGLEDPGALPVAALTRLADTDSWDPGWWLRLDPVHLHTDRDSLVLFPTDMLELAADEGAALAAAVRDHLAEDGWTLEANRPERWYLRCEPAPDCRFSDLDQVAGRQVLPFMPEGRDAARFRRLLNELQMLLHAHPVNRAREAAGRFTANSVWAWGGGAFDELAPARWDGVWAQDPLLRGLAMLAGNHPESPPEGFASWLAALPEGRGLVVLSEAVPLEALEADWFEPMLLALREKMLDRLRVEAGGRLHELTPAGLRRFWRRRRPVAQLLALPEA